MPKTEFVKVFDCRRRRVSDFIRVCQERLTRATWSNRTKLINNVPWEKNGLKLVSCPDALSLAACLIWPD